MRINTQLDRQRLALGLTAVFAFSAAFATMAAQPASATPPIVPPGCGPYSGVALPAGWTLDDHSADTSPLGTLASPYFVPATANVITIGTAFGDVIRGNNVNEVQCGLGGSDWLRGGGGDDELYGGNGPDSLMGEENSDFESGGHARDTIYGDDGTDSHGNLDFADELQGGDKNDWLFGGDGFDTIRGGNGASDEVDGGAAGADCAADIEVGLATC